MSATERFRSICTLTSHGHLDPMPKLGRTDTGGQVVYVLELSKALSRLGHHGTAEDLRIFQSVWTDHRS